jgi:hypothetical protein
MSRNVRTDLLVSSTSLFLFALLVGGCGPPATGPLGDGYDQAAELLATQYNHYRASWDPPVASLDALITMHEGDYYVHDTTSVRGIRTWIMIADIEGLVPQPAIELGSRTPTYSSDLFQCSFTYLFTEPEPTEWVVPWLSGTVRIPWRVHDSTYYGSTAERLIIRPLAGADTIMIELPGAQSNSWISVWGIGRDSTDKSVFLSWSLPDNRGIVLDSTMLATVRALSEAVNLTVVRQYRSLQEVSGKRIGQTQRVAYTVILEP